MSEIDDEIRVARKCVRCGKILYVSMDDASHEASICESCRIGSLPIAEETPRRGGLFSRSRSVTSEVLLPSRAEKQEPAHEPATQGGAGGTDFDEMEIVRAGNVNPTFTATPDAPRYKVIVPVVIVLIIGALGLGFLLIREPAQLPDTPAGDRTAWLIDAMNDSRSTTLEAIQLNFSQSAVRQLGAPALLNQIRGWDHRHNAYRVGRIVDAEDRHRLVSLITTESMDWGELVVEVEEVEPHRIRSFTIGPADPPR